MEQDTLRTVGWSERWEALFAAHAAAGLAPSRVIRCDRTRLLAVGATGVVQAQVATRLVKTAANAAALPAVGDWVGLRFPPGHTHAVVEVVLPRCSALTRGDPGKATAGQVLAANVDLVFVVHPISPPPNLRRIERELAVVWSSGAVPVVVLTKADLDDAAGAVREMVTAALGVEVLLTSALAGRGIEQITARVSGGATAALIGPSGAGKSTLINALLGTERQATREVRAVDGKGRHATVARELVSLPGGGALVDTPGLRALSVWDIDEGLPAAFPDIATLASTCRFRDCKHAGEPGCAVVAAVDRGELSPERLESWQKLQREAEAVERRQDAQKQREYKNRGREFSKMVRRYYKRYRS